MIEQLLADMAQNGLHLHSEPNLDGQLHRYGKNGPHDDKDEWYIGFLRNDYIYCTYGSWSDDEARYNYQSGNIDPELKAQYDLEIKQQRQLALQEREKEQQLAAHKAKQLYACANECSDRQYLANKGIKTYKAKQLSPETTGTLTGINDHSIVIPLQNIDGDIVSLQFIFDDGTKRMLKNGKSKGSFYSINDKEHPKKIYITEGIATAHSIAEATDQMTVSTQGLDNINPVTCLLKDKHPQAKLYLCQDVGDKENIHASQWKEKYNGAVYKPKSDVKGYDFNDLHKEKGLKELQKQLKHFIMPSIDAGDILLDQSPPRKWVITNHVIEGSCTMVHARGGVGKSRYLLELAISLVTWKKFMYWEVPERKNVLYIDTELTAKQIKERLIESITRRKADWDDNLLRFVIKQELADQEFYGFNLYEQQTQEALDSLVENYDVIILDNLQNALIDRKSEGKENKAEDWVVFYSWIKRWLRRGKTFFLAHHQGKSGEYRGTTRMEGDVDNIIRLTRPTDCFDVALAFQVDFDKGRDIPFQNQRPILAKLNPNESKRSDGWVLETPKK